MKENTPNTNGNYDLCRFCSEDLRFQKKIVCLVCNRSDLRKKGTHLCNGKNVNHDKWKIDTIRDAEFCCTDHKLVWKQIRRDIEEQHFLDKQNKREFTEDELKTFARIKDFLTNY